MKRRIGSWLFMATSCCMLATLSGYTAADEGKNELPDTLKGMFKNPIAAGADPWVIKSGKYYYTCLSNGNVDSKGISVCRSLKLTEPGSKITVWTAPDTGWNSTQIWAPELHHMNNRWYIYYAAGRKKGAPYIHQRSGVLESVSDDPQGQYIDRGLLQTGVDKNDPSGTIWAIDVNVASIKGKLYAVWSGWEKNMDTDKTSQQLYIAEMSNPWTISSKRVKLSGPDQPWEQGGPLNLNEGPEFLLHKGQVFIIYSTRESWTPEYRLGQLRLKDPARSLLDAANWLKSGPVFQGTQTVHGTGHASFTTSPDGKEWWMIYHTKRSTKPGWERDIMMQKFKWDKDGNPDFGKPEPAGKLLKKPSGEEGG
ncbi:family 43 glycosylhydrolase [Pedobacter heparinus]|nr:glycoside hydrolase family 43 protein [Pedobacter heparinus]